MTENYNASSIEKMSAIEHIRAKSTMYIGSTGNPNHLIIEVFENSLDECSSGANKIVVNIDNKNGVHYITDNGRGMPYDKKLKLEDDPPILICTTMYTSGKFKKGKEDSNYSTGVVGTHGIGNCAVYALSEYMNIDIYKNKEHAIYSMNKDGNISRNFEKYNNEKPYSTKVEFKPSSKYFESCKIDISKIRNRLLIASANFPELNIDFIVDGNKEEIKYTEEQLLQEYLSTEISNWFSFDLTHKKNENGYKCVETGRIVLGWDTESEINKNKSFSSVNVLNVADGPHVTKVSNSVKTILLKYAKKENKEFDENDCLNWFRLYVNLKILDPKFDSQNKEKLSKSTKLDILDDFEKQFENAVKKNYEYFKELLDKFEEYHKSLQSKKILNITSKKRGSSQFTKLRDCKLRTGELIIGEGDSAIGGLVKMRDPNIHALLPLRGVVANACDTPIQKLMTNEVVSDIIKAVGTGISPGCKIDDIRYSRIILTADADPAGHFINTLLVGLFMKLMPEIIQSGLLYICEPPLYGHGYDDKFTALWTEDDVKTAKASNKHIRRFKGLGEYSNIELKRYILNPKERKLTQLEWHDNIKSLSELLSSSVERRKLMMGEWEL